MRNAQRRPGHQPRRHECTGLSHSRHRLSTAQRRPGHQPRRHLRTPTKPVPGWPPPLNEGRGISPGDTSRDRASTTYAQRRPGHQPRRHSRPRTGSTLNEGRGISPGDTLKSAKGRYRDGTAVFHRCGGLDGDEFAAISRNCEQYSVRMITAKQSKLPWRRRTTRGSQNH